MKKILIVAAVSAIIVAGCKTSEANYRAAYEKAVAGRDSVTPIENTIYGSHRRAVVSSLGVAGRDTVEIISARVAVTKDAGGINENLRAYSVVVGQFKQLVNARSMRNRLVDAGYPATFVVNTAEPYYYVLVASYGSRNEAVEAAVALRADAAKFPIPLAAPLPLVLYTPR